MHQSKLMFVVGIGLVLLSAWGRAEDSTPKQAQSKLRHLNAKIGDLKQRLVSFHQQQSDAEHALAKIDKQTGLLSHRLLSLTQSIAQKQVDIQSGSKRMHTLTLQLAQQQGELMKQVKMIFMLGATQPLKGVLMAKDPRVVENWIFFYQYILRARQGLIDNISETNRALATTRVKLTAEIKVQAALKAQLMQEQQTLQHLKKQQTHLITSITNHIQVNQHSLQGYERDKAALQGLLQHLLVQSQAQAAPPREQQPERQRLPSPLKVAYLTVKPWNQGLLFLAQEGKPVYAVQAGRVVFSDWLRGYGLLLILDHGGGWMSLYGYNQSLYRHVGEWVNVGAQIATVGHSGGRRENGLYFEVRRSGHVVAARPWLQAKAARFAKL